jgi:hypothetical protein
MKKSLLFAVVCSLSYMSRSQMQINNSDFELWESTTSELAEPINWNSFKTASGTWSSFSGQQLDKSTSVRPGSSGIYSARIFSRNAGFGVIANGNMTLGKIEMGSSTANSDLNYNYSITSNPNFSEAFTDSPDSLVVWVKYTPVTSSGNNARVSAVIHNNTDGYKDPNDVAGANTIATAILNFPSVGGWQRISIPFAYVGAVEDASYIMVTFTTNSTPGGGSANDELLIDDLQLIYNPSEAGIQQINSNKFKLFSENDQLLIFGQISPKSRYSILAMDGSLIQEGETEPVVPFDATAGVYIFQVKESENFYRTKFIKK